MYSTPKVLEKCPPCPPDAANREENYAAKSEIFQAHSRKMADTATALAKSGVVKDRQLADDLISTAKKVCALYVHVCAGVVS